MKLLFTIFVVVALTVLSAAQDGAKSALQGSMVDAVGLPGQGWTSVGNLSPIEHNNFYTQSYFEQSAAVFSTYSGSITVTPFIGMGLVLDTKGYEWNNKVQPRLGVKVNKYFRKGVVSIGSAYSYEDRFKSFNSSGLTVFVRIGSAGSRSPKNQAVSPDPHGLKLATCRPSSTATSSASVISPRVWLPRGSTGPRWCRMSRPRFS